LPESENSGMEAEARAARRANGPAGANGAAGLAGLLAQRAPLVTPGVYDALSALLVEQAGFACAYVSGAAVSYTRLGRPDVGLVTLSELVQAVSLMRERVSLPLVVDADTGFGSPLNVRRTVRALERAGATAIQLEDQVMPKRCGHMSGKALVSEAEARARLRAALDARHSALIVARTDAIGVEGFEAALARAESYLQEGVDALFIEAPRSRAELARIGEMFGAKLPLIANMVEGGQTPRLSSAALGSLGYALVLYPGALVRASVFAQRTLLEALREKGDSAASAGGMLNFAELNAVLGLDELQRLEAQDSAAPQAPAPGAEQP